jgi:hypothetical protein
MADARTYDLATLATLVTVPRILKCCMLIGFREIYMFKEFFV